jgi:CD63 antigen
MVSGGMSCVKYLLFAFNLVFVIFGILLLYSGFKTIANIDHYHLLLDEAPHNVAIALVIVGFAIFAVAFLGCCGAIKENACMLTSFSSIILVILLIELIGAGLIFAFKSTLKSAAEKGIEAAIGKYNMTDNSTEINLILDDIQKNMKCCGAVNASDWQSHNKYPADNYPPSCCATEITTKFCIKPYDQGCIDKLEADVKGSIGLLGGIAIAVAVIQLIGIIFSCSLSRSIKREYEVV